MTDRLESMQLDVDEVRELRQRVSIFESLETKRMNDAVTADDWRRIAERMEYAWRCCSYGFNKRCGELSQQLAECQKECEEEARLNGAGGSREAALMARLKESQAREKVLCDLRFELDGVIADVRNGIGFDQISTATVESVIHSLAMPQDSTALDAAIRQAKREALLDAADRVDALKLGGEESHDTSVWECGTLDSADAIRRMADELK